MWLKNKTAEMRKTCSPVNSCQSQGVPNPGTEEADNMSRCRQQVCR